MTELAITGVASLFLTLKPERQTKMNNAKISVRKAVEFIGDQQLDLEQPNCSAKNNTTVGLVIPCHKSARRIKETLKRALIHFPPENIIVMDKEFHPVPWMIASIKSTKFHPASNTAGFLWVTGQPLSCWAVVCSQTISPI